MTTVDPLNLGVWFIDIACGAGIAYMATFGDAILRFRRALNAPNSMDGYKDAVTPPWTTTLGFLVCGATIAVTAASWWTFGAYGGCISVFVSIASVIGFRRIIPAEDNFHYKKLIILSMADRYVDYVRANDQRRAATLKELLNDIGVPVEYEPPSKNPDAIGV
jgi:hypothetical protein